MVPAPMIPAPATSAVVEPFTVMKATQLEPPLALEAQQPVVVLGLVVQLAAALGLSYWRGSRDAKRVTPASTQSVTPALSWSGPETKAVWVASPGSTWSLTEPCCPGASEAVQASMAAWMRVVSE